MSLVKQLMEQYYLSQTTAEEMVRMIPDPELRKLLPVRHVDTSATCRHPLANVKFTQSQGIRLRKLLMPLAQGDSQQKQLAYSIKHLHSSLSWGEQPMSFVTGLIAGLIRQEFIVRDTPPQGVLDVLDDAFEMAGGAESENALPIRELHDDIIEGYIHHEFDAPLGAVNELGLPVFRGPFPTNDPEWLPVIREAVGKYLARQYGFMSKGPKWADLSLWLTRTYHAPAPRELTENYGTDEHRSYYIFQWFGANLQDFVDRLARPVD